MGKQNQLTSTIKRISTTSGVNSSQN